MHFLVFDRAPQPFDENIVHETTASVHRNRDACSPEPAGEGGAGDRPGAIDARTRQIQQRTLPANRQILGRPLDHRPALGNTHRPGLLAKKSLSTVNWQSWYKASDR